MVSYLDKVLIPYIARTRIDVTYPALVIYDTFCGQCTERILSNLEDNNIHVAIVPANYTDRLQPLDLSINKAAKEFLRKQFSNWYSDKICQQLRRGVKPVTTLWAQWMIALYDYFKSRPDIAKNGFKEAGTYTNLK